MALDISHGKKSMCRIVVGSVNWREMGDSGRDANHKTLCDGTSRGKPNVVL